MKTPEIKSLLIPAVVMLFFAGCKKVIAVNLKNVSPQIVITGEVNNLPGPYTVTVSKSVDYTSDNIFPAVSGALVVITGNGVADTLTENSAGTYTTHTIAGLPGNSYSLLVSAEGQQYNASSVMPRQVPLDSIGFTTTGGNNTTNAVVYFQDPAGIANYYEFIEFSNNRGWSVFDDRLSDGRFISNTLFDDSTDIKPGDTLTVQMKCVDKGVYNYLFTLSLISGSNNFSAPTPANPTSNITNNALGYFTANTVQSKTAVVR
jgi:hypothetical protein